jgi:nucleoside-diphosphate-sugar epimerase
MMNGTALVTGANGMLGSYLTSELTKRGANVVTLGRNSFGTYKNFPIQDVKSRKTIFEAIESVKPKYIFHLAGVFAAKNEFDFEDVNVNFGRILLEALNYCKLEKHVRVLFVGSAAEYGTPSQKNLPVTEADPTIPVSRYGQTKRLCTQIALDWSTADRHLVIVRPFNLLGFGLSTSLSIGRFIGQIFNSPRETVELSTGCLDNYRDFLDARDCAWLMCEAICSDESNGQVYNLCSGQPVLIRDMLDYIIAKSGKTVHTQISDRLVRSNDIKYHYGCNKKIKELVGPIDLIAWTASIDHIIVKQIKRHGC